MKILIGLVIIFSTSLSLAAVSFTGFPTTEVNGVEHYLADFDEHRNIWLDSASGYCVIKGYSYAASTTSYITNVGPVVVLDDKGQVIETAADNSNNKYSIVSSVSCQ